MLRENKSVFIFFHSNEEYGAAYPDKIADKEIAELKVFCPNKRNGCVWSERLKFLQVSFPPCRGESYEFLPVRPYNCVTLTSFSWNLFISFFFLKFCTVIEN